MKDLVIMGAGPAGYVAALRAARLDLEVTVIDPNDRPGGVCLNWGCIPTKAFLHLAKRYEFIRRADSFGFKLDLHGVDWEQLVVHTRGIVEELSSGIEKLFKKNGIELLKASARLVAPERVAIGSGEELSAKNILIATGARPISFPGVEPNGDRIMTSREALMLKTRPETLLVIGGGAIGLEFAYLYQTFGTRVKLFEMAGQLLPGVDREVADQLASQLEGAGIELHLDSPAKALVQDADCVRLATEAGGEYSGSAALLALGMQPSENPPWADKLNLRRDQKGWLKVDGGYRTSLPGVYAAGDVIGPPLLAHVASAEGRRVAETIAGRAPEPLNYQQIPAAVFCSPQVATFGLAEQAARKKYRDVTVGKFPFAALGRAKAEAADDGFVKLIFGGEFQRLLGAQMVGEGVADLVAELSLGASLEATVEELIATLHIHPTRSEAVSEAALAALDRQLHI